VVVWRLETAGDGRSEERERESLARGERGSGLYDGVNASTVHRCS